MGIYKDLCEAIDEAAKQVSLSKTTFKSSDIRAIIESHPEWPTFEPSYPENFSKAVVEGGCIVERVPGKYLYQIRDDQNGDLSSEAESATDASDSQQGSATDANANESKVRREVRLYSTLRDWLESLGYQSEVTSENKTGGRWGNPDVTGLRLDSLPFGPVGVECVTVEAKLTSSDWRYYIFEAVAHKRFAHRAWFAFAVGSDNPDLSTVKDRAALSEYAEKYRVGVAVVFITKDHYKQLTEGDAASLDLGPDDVRIEVLWPAVYETVHVPALREYLTNTLESNDPNGIGKFGR